MPSNGGKVAVTLFVTFALFIRNLRKNFKVILYYFTLLIFFCVFIIKVKSIMTIITISKKKSMESGSRQGVGAEACELSLREMNYYILTF